MDVSDVHAFLLDSAPAYYSLSYTWGQTHTEETISLSNGQTLALTKNLK